MYKTPAESPEALLSVQMCLKYSSERPNVFSALQKAETSYPTPKGLACTTPAYSSDSEPISE